MYGKIKCKSLLIVLQKAGQRLRFVFTLYLVKTILKLIIKNFIIYNYEFFTILHIFCNSSFESFL